MSDCDHIKDALSTGPQGECLLCAREVLVQANGSAWTGEGAPIPPRPLDVRVQSQAGNAPAVVMEWKVQPGERVEPGTIILLVERAGIVEPIVSPGAGTLGIHRAREGVTIPPNFVLARLLPPAPLAEVSAALAEAPMASPDFVFMLPEQAAAPIDPPIIDPGQADSLAEAEVQAKIATGIEAEVQVEVDVEVEGNEAEEATPSPIEPAPLPDAPGQAELPEAARVIAPNGEEPSLPLSGEPDEREAPPEADKPPFDPAVQMSEDAKVIEELAKLRAQGVFVVSLVGFYAGGKTWFLHRLKHELRLSGMQVDPAPANEGEAVERTNNFSVHHIRARGRLGGPPRAFAIIDMPGETVDRLVRDPMRGPRALLAALNASGALIVALPADEVMLSGAAADVVALLDAPDTALDKHQRERAAKFRPKMENPAYAARLKRLAEADSQLTSLTNKLCNVTAMLSTMRELRIPISADVSQSFVDQEMINAHVNSGKFAPFRTPTFIALTKADQITALDEVGADLLDGEDTQLLAEMQSDPRHLVIEHREPLVALLDHWFEHHKFDFVAAFRGHKGGFRMSYSRHSSRGITGVISWISWVRQNTPPSRLQQYAMNCARALRNLRDGRIKLLNIDQIGRKSEDDYGTG